MSAHANFLVIHRQVHHTSAELKKQFLWITIPTVLLHSVVNCLLCQSILQFKGHDWQAVYKDAEVKRQLCLIFAIPQLACHAKNVSCMQSGSLLVTWRRHAKIHLKTDCPVLDSVAKYVDDTALGNLALKPMKKLRPLWSFYIESQPR